MPYGQFIVPLVQRSSFHGSDLVRILPDGDAPATADNILLVAERAGWIVRGIYQPIAQQIFFGAAGLKGIRKELFILGKVASAPRLYHWITNWARWDDQERIWKRTIKSRI